VRRAPVEQAEQREQAAPGGAAVAATLGGEAPELVEQPAQAVGLVVDRVVDREQLARLGEEDHHEPHDEVAGGGVDVVAGVRRPRRGPSTGARPRSSVSTARRTRSPSSFDSFACPRRVARIASSSRLRSAPSRSSAGGRRGDGARKGVRELVGVEPAIGVPLDPGEVVGVGPDEAPLAAVGEERELDGRTAATEVLDDVGDGLPALADADARGLGREQRERVAGGALPNALRLEAGAVEQASRRRARLTAEPLRQPTTEAAGVLEHDIEEGAEGLAAGLGRDRGRRARSGGVRRGDRRPRRARTGVPSSIGESRLPPCRSEVQASWRFTSGPPGVRISTATGYTCDSPRRV
jgi:hypothetical protein